VARVFLVAFHAPSYAEKSDNHDWSPPNTCCFAATFGRRVRWQRLRLGKLAPTLYVAIPTSDCWISQ
jgi:hypothetical protein